MEMIIKLFKIGQNWTKLALDAFVCAKPLRRARGFGRGAFSYEI